MADSAIGAFTGLFTIDGMVARAELAQALAKVHTFLGDGAAFFLACWAAWGGQLAARWDKWLDGDD